MSRSTRRSAPGATLGRAALTALFALALRAVYDVEVSGLDNNPQASPVYYAIQHKRDLDPMLPLPSIVAHRGRSALGGDLRFAMRADAFAPGFLARIAAHPRALAFLTRPLSVGPVLRWLAVYPQDSPRLRPAELWLRDTSARARNLPSHEVVADGLIERLAASTGESAQRLASRPLSTLLAWRYQLALQGFTGADILEEPWRHDVRRAVVAQVHEQIDTLAAWLRAGGSLFGSPEGQLSPDGRISPISAGFHRLVRGGPPTLTVVPIVMSYDFITVRRQRVFVEFAAPVDASPDMPPSTLDARLRSAWLGAGRFTTTQLASGYLVGRSRLSQPSFTLSDLRSALLAQARHLHDAGRLVDDRLLEPARAPLLAWGFVRYALRHGLVREIGGGRYLPVVGDLTINVAPREVGYLQQPLAYAYNELCDLLSLDAPTTSGAWLVPSGRRATPLLLPRQP